MEINMLPLFKSILCLNGRLPAKNWFLKYQNAILVAADGAANTLAAMDIIPDFIIGDLDSVNLSIISCKEEIIKIADQDTTDFEKCLFEMQKRDLFPSLILGISGGELDHTIYNLNCFMQYAKKHSLFFLDIDEHNKYKLGFSAFANIDIADSKGKTISLLPFTQAIVSTKGLRWELNSCKLSVANNSSVRNVVVEELASIQVNNGELLILLDYTYIK
jgi:thiamine pyrophosphokinase